MKLQSNSKEVFRCQRYLKLPMTVARCLSSVKNWIRQQRHCQMLVAQVDKSWLRSQCLKPPQKIISSTMIRGNHHTALKTRVLMTTSSS